MVDHGTAELGAVMGEAAGGLLDMAETLKGRPVCAGRPDLGPCKAFADVLIVGCGRYDAAVEEEPLANVDVEAEEGEPDVEGPAP